jgi:hypothetical protein
MAELMAMAKASDEAEFQQRLELGRRVARREASDAEMALFGLIGRSPLSMTEVRPLHYVDRKKQLEYCRLCHELFFANRPVRCCSRRCLRAWWNCRPRRSRAKVKDELCCGRCGQPSTPKRSDARYCSARCRVAAHRTRRE